VKLPSCDFDEELNEISGLLKFSACRWQKEKWHVTFGAKETSQFIET